MGTAPAVLRRGSRRVPIAPLTIAPWIHFRMQKGETRMKTTRIAAATMLTVASAFMLHVAQAQQPPGPHRTDLQRHDLSIAGWETVQARVDFVSGAFAPKHRHPGEEIIYVEQGSLEYQVEGKPTVTLKAGDVLFIPKGVAHSAKNVGPDNASELATYVVEKGKPLVQPVK
jgi:quercetin dioxygenase-like cupin family protein